MTIIISCILGLIPASIAKSKGRNFVLWWLYGAALFIVALIHSLLLKEDKNKNVKNISGTKEIQQYSINLPVVVTNYSFKNKEDKLFLNVSLGNMSPQTVSSIKMDVYGFDSFGEEIIVNETNHFQMILQDMNLTNNKLASFDITAPLPSLDIRKVKIIPTTVLTDDGQVYNAEIVDFNIDREKEDESNYKPKENDKYWLCSCGYINSLERETCNYCNKNKKELFNTTNCL